MLYGWGNDNLYMENNNSNNQLDSNIYSPDYKSNNVALENSNEKKELGVENYSYPYNNEANVFYSSQNDDSKCVKLDEFTIKKVKSMSFSLIVLTLVYIVFVILTLYFGIVINETTDNLFILIAMTIMSLMFMIIQTIILEILKKKVIYSNFYTKSFKFVINSPSLLLLSCVCWSLRDISSGHEGLFITIIFTLLFMVLSLVLFTLSAITALFLPFVVANFVIKKSNE